MTKHEFAQRRLKGRSVLFASMLSEFKKLDPISIHQFGSGTKGYKDEFSDIDIWVTFKDEDIKKVLNKASHTFRNIAPILVKHRSKTWSPVGGSSQSIIHEVGPDLFVVDYYISKLSETVLKKDSLVIWGNNSVKKGEWRLNRHVNPKTKDSHTLRKDVDLFLDLIFISYKGIVRKWDDEEFVKTLRLVHKNFHKRYPGKLKKHRISLSYNSSRRLLNDLYLISNKRQKRAINKIRKYGRLIEELYYDGKE